MADRQCITDTFSCPAAAAEPDRQGEELEAAQHRSHRRGLAPFVFVPWDQVRRTALPLAPAARPSFVAIQGGLFG